MFSAFLDFQKSLLFQIFWVLILMAGNFFGGGFLLDSSST